MLQTSAQLKILNYRLKNCGNTCTTNDEDDKPEGTEVIQFECIQVHTTLQNFDANEELIKCIQHYQQIFQ